MKTLTTEEIERYIEEQEEMEMEERKIRRQKTYADREEMLNDMGMESYDEWIDSQYDE